MKPNENETYVNSNNNMFGRTDDYYFLYLKEEYASGYK